MSSWSHPIDHKRLAAILGHLRALRGEMLKRAQRAEDRNLEEKNKQIMQEISLLREAAAGLHHAVQVLKTMNLTKP